MADGLRLECDCAARPGRFGSGQSLQWQRNATAPLVGRPSSGLSVGAATDEPQSPMQPLSHAPSEPNANRIRSLLDWAIVGADSSQKAVSQATHRATVETIA